MRALREPGPLRAMGASAAEIAAVTHGSPNLVNGVFANRERPPEAGGPDVGTFVDMLRSSGSPKGTLPVMSPHLSPEPDGMSVSWLGHATAIVDVDGVRILVDPVLSARCSPSQLVGPKRMHRAPVSAPNLPAIDVVLLSHDHYDHLDVETVTAIAATQPDARFVAPIGVDAHLEHWGVAKGRITTADWQQSRTVTVRGVEVTFGCVPARHFSGRGLTRNNTLWASWSVTGPGHSFFFSGDTGFTDAYREVGDRHGPFDATLIAIGAYDPAWPDIHLNPEEAVAVHSLVNGGDTESLLVPIHWGTFNLARHPWGDPVRRLMPAAEAASVDVCVPRPGSTVQVDDRTGTAFDDLDWWGRHV